MTSAQTALSDAAEETGYADTFGLIADMTGDIRRTLTISSDEWYETLERNLAYSTENTSGAEKEYWQKSLSSVVTMLTGVLLSAFIMFLSEMFSSTQVVVITMAFFLVSFFRMPDWLGIIAKLWQLRPNVVLHLSALNGSILYGRKFNIYEMSTVVYLIAAIAFVTITGIIYKRSQVKSR